MGGNLMRCRAGCPSEFVVLSLEPSFQFVCWEYVLVMNAAFVNKINCIGVLDLDFGVAQYERGEILFARKKI